VLYSQDGKSVWWAANTNGKGGDRLTIQNDGNFVLYDGGSAVWASNTN
jgi:hypothetical protein